jgi:phospholipid/cholesterol/gamma-HCH transport system permease protein
MLAGRAGVLTLVGLGTVLGSDRYAVLRASGIDPFLLLVVARVLAFALASFALNILFIVGALVAAGRQVMPGARAMSAWLGFLDDVLRAMRPNDVEVLPLKGVLIGGVVAAICCAAALGAPLLAATPTRLIPRRFADAILGTFLVPGLVSAVL